MGLPSCGVYTSLVVGMTVAEWLVEMSFEMFNMYVALSAWVCIGLLLPFFYSSITCVLTTS